MQNERGLIGQVRFSHGLSLWRAMSRGLGVVVITIALVLSGESVGLAGRLAWLAVILAGLLALANCLGYAELAVSVRRPGGAYALIRESTRRGELAFFAGWTLALAALGLCGLLAKGAAQSISPRSFPASSA